MIPRIIHQTYPRLSLPEALRVNIENIRQMNPEFDHRLYDDEAARALIGAEFGGSMTAVYDSIDPSYGAAKADLFRYLAMFSYGGVYLDIKSTTIRPLSTTVLPTDHLVLSHWKRRAGREHWGVHPELAAMPAGELQQWHIIAAPRHPFIGAVVNECCRRLKRYSPWRDGVGWLAVLRTTGPIMYTQTAISTPRSREGRLVAGEDELGLEYSIFSDDAGHKRLFSGHYVQNARPLTRPQDPRRIAFWAHRQQARARAALRTLLTPDNPA